MILTSGDVSKLQGADWYALELRSEKTIEGVMRRVGSAIHGIFREDPIEIFIPVFKRDLDVFEMGTMNLIFVRSTNISGLLRLKTVTGVVQLMTEGDSNRPNKAIKISDDYVQSLIKDSKKEWAAHSEGIEVDSFVRLLNGETRDFCGTVQLMGEGRSIVKVVMKTKSVLIDTPTKNLLNLSYVPKEQRVWYYGSLVSELVSTTGAAGAELIAEDLTNEDINPALPEYTDGPESLEPKKHTRQRTVTALVKKLILIDNLHEPMEIAKKVVAALKNNEVKAPKNLFISYCFPGNTMMQGLIPGTANVFAEKQILDMNGDLQNVTDSMQRSYRGPVVRLDVAGTLAITPTPEHELYVLRCKKPYQVKGEIYPLRPTWKNQKEEDWEKLWVPAKDVRSTDFLLCPAKLPQVNEIPQFTTSNHHLAKTINLQFKPSADLVWLFGLYIADGGVSGSRETGWSLNICMNTRTDRKRVARAFRKLGVDTRFEEHENYGYACVNSVSLVETFIRWFGRDCYTKQIPTFLFGWHKFLPDLVAGYAEGDGTKNQKGVLATTVSLKLAHQLWYILVGLGCYPFLSPLCQGGEKVTIKGQDTVAAPSWKLWWTEADTTSRHDTFYYKGHYCMPVERVSTEEFHGQVFNFSVQNTESYIANGVVAHNCIIKDNLSKLYFKKTDPSISNYRDVIHKYGRKYKFSANDILKLDPSLGIPVQSEEICKDGRSREARQRVKLQKEQLKAPKKPILRKAQKA